MQPWVPKQRGEDGKFHYFYQVSWKDPDTKALQIYYGIHSTANADLDPWYMGSGKAVKAARRRGAEFVKQVGFFFPGREALEDYEAEIVDYGFLTLPWVANQTTGGTDKRIGGRHDPHRIGLDNHFEAIESWKRLRRWLASGYSR